MDPPLSNASLLREQRICCCCFRRGHPVREFEDTTETIRRWKRYSCWSDFLPCPFICCGTYAYSYSTLIYRLIMIVIVCVFTQVFVLFSFNLSYGQDDNNNPDPNNQELANILQMSTNQFNINILFANTCYITYHIRDSLRRRDIITNTILYLFLVFQFLLTILMLANLGTSVYRFLTPTYSFTVDQAHTFIALIVILGLVELSCILIILFYRFRASQCEESRATFMIQDRYNVVAQREVNTLALSIDDTDVNVDSFFSQTIRRMTLQQQMSEADMEEFQAKSLAKTYSGSNHDQKQQQLALQQQQGEMQYAQPPADEGQVPLLASSRISIASARKNYNTQSLVNNNNMRRQTPTVTSHIAHQRIPRNEAKRRERDRVEAQENEQSEAQSNDDGDVHSISLTRLPPPVNLDPEHNTVNAIRSNGLGDEFKNQ